MSLYCGACDSDMRGGYVILGFLGHPKATVMEPVETPASILLCQRHFHPSDTVENLQQLKDQLVFSLVRGGAVEGGNYNGNFSLSQEDSLKKTGDFEHPLYVGGKAVKKRLPDVIDHLRECIKALPRELQESLTC